MEHAPRSVLLDHRGKLARVPASVHGAYDCSVCYDRCEASPEWPVATATRKDDPTGHCTRREKERQTEKEMGRQRNGMDRIKVG